MTRQLILNAHIIDPATGFDRPGHIAIAGGQLVAIGEAPQGFTADQTFDAQGLIAAPGLVDLCARLRDPAHRTDDKPDPELQAAVAGGVTTLVCPPDTEPPMDEPGLVRMLRDRAERMALADVRPLGALTRGLAGNDLAALVQLAESGCIGFSQAEHAMADTQVLLRAMQYAATHGLAVWLRPQDAFIGKGGVAASGAVATRLGLSGVPVASETVALFTIFELMRSSGCRVHLCRLSSAKGVEMLRAAKAEGLPVTADVSVHNLHLSDNDLGYFDSHYRLTPVLRTPRDRDVLSAGLADGTIDALCSDHTPVASDDKLLPFASAAPGASAVELLLPLALKWAQASGRSTLLAIDCVTQRAARAAGLQAGRLQPGEPANMVLFDPHEPWVVNAGNLRSHSVCTPFAGLELVGRVRATWARGKLVHNRLS
jgi:dihydroorotase